MGDSSPPGPTDAHRLAKFLVGLATIVVLTPAGVLSACLSVAICRFFGRRSHALWMVSAAGLFLFERILAGEPEGFSDNYWQVYLRPLLRSEFAQYQAWERLCSSIPILEVVVQLGIFGGSLYWLAALDKSGSALERLKSGTVAFETRVAPFAKLMRSFINFRPSSRNGAVIIGTEFETGKEVTISASDRAKHILVLGTTGAGKTVTIKSICKSDIDGGHGGVFIDGKGDAELGNELVA